MKKIAISIGVSKAGSLPQLSGAVNGAKDFAEWADKAGYEKHLITDEAGPVAAKLIKDVVAAIVKDGDTSRLIIYFAGHGTQPREGAQYWLLSDWENDANETVDVVLSASAAKRSGIAQISFIADACRSHVSGASTMSGSVIFPKRPPVAGPSPQWDQFYGARIDEDAQEVTAADAAKAYGVFSRCLMQALNFSDAGAAQVVGAQTDRRLVVTSKTLANYIDKVLPYESGRLPGARVQWPDTNSGWRSPDDVYTEKTIPGVADSQELADRRTAAFSLDRVSFWQNISIDSTLLREKLVRPLTDDLENRRRYLADARRRAPESDIAVVGADVREIVTGTEPVHAGPFHKSLAVELKLGGWIGLCALPGFQVTAVVVRAAAVSVTYQQQGIPIAPVALTPQLDRWMAVMAVGRHPELEEVIATLDTMAQRGAVDPSLAILGAYTCERAGRLDKVDDIVDLFGQVRRPVPFDIALLSRAGLIVSNERMIAFGTTQRQVPVAGAFPFVSLGWNYLEPGQAGVDSRLLELRSGLTRGLWTSFDPSTGRKFADLIREGKL